MVESGSGEVVQGVGGEEGVPGDGVSVGHSVEQLAGVAEKAAFGVGGDDVVGEEAVGGGAGGDDVGVG